MIFCGTNIDVFIQQEGSFLGNLTGQLHRAKAVAFSADPTYRETKRLGPNRQSYVVSRDYLEHGFSLTKETRLGALDLALLQAMLHCEQDGTQYTFSCRAAEDTPSISVFVTGPDGLLYRLSGAVVERLVISVRPREVLTMEVQGRAAICSLAGGLPGEFVDEPAGSLTHLDSTVAIIPAVQNLTDLSIVMEGKKAFIRSPAPSGVTESDLRITGSYSHYVSSINPHTMLGQTGAETTSLTLRKGGAQLQATLAGPVWGKEPTKTNGDSIRQVNIEPSSWSIILSTP